jgi:hypothetical protein
MNRFHLYGFTALTGRLSVILANQHVLFRLRIRNDQHVCFTEIDGYCATSTHLPGPIHIDPTHFALPLQRNSSRSMVRKTVAKLRLQHMGLYLRKRRV